MKSPDGPRRGRGASRAPTYVGTGEAGRMLGVGPNAVYRLVAEGRLTAYRIAGGKRLMYDADEVRGLVRRVTPRGAVTTPTAARDEAAEAFLRTLGLM